MSDINDENVSLSNESIKEINLDEIQGDEIPIQEIPTEENPNEEIPSEEKEKIENVITKIDKNIELRKNIDNEIINVEKYYKKKAYYNNLKRKQITKISIG